MATLFFNPQESAILQLFHQDGEYLSAYPALGGWFSSAENKLLLFL